MNNCDKEVTVTNTFYARVVKRVLDIILSSLALLGLLPFLFIIIILEFVFHGFPAFYVTRRPGKNSKIIKIYKFRSMTNEHGKDGLLLPENERLTDFGRVIRKLSIDELPELWSVLKGDMSIIGPRPLLIEYLDMYTPRHAMRHSVRPGLACVRINRKGLSNTWTWRDQFENDIYYIEHISFLTDVKMVFAVLREVIKGADYRENDTRVPFDGSNLDELRSKSEVGIISHFNSIG